MDTMIFHSVNAGLYFWNGKSGVLVDGIHQGQHEGCSPMPEFLVMQLRRKAGMFANLTGVLFTHLHNDHFDCDNVECLLALQPDIQVYGPGLHRGGVPIRPICSDLRTVRLGGIYVLAEDTVHDGERFRNDPHQSYLIRMSGETFFIAGDALLTPKEGERLSGFYGGGIDGVFVNLYQLADPRGQAFLRLLEPKRIFLYHLPFRKDDRYRYYSLARQAVKRLPDDLQYAEILPHMAWIDQKPAQWEIDEGGSKEVCAI